MNNSKRQFRGKRVLVTGACGTVGAELVRQLMCDPIYQPEEIVCLDNNESALFFLDQEYSDFANVQFFIADVCDLAELTSKMRGIDLVFHCAAYKHVIISERSPEQVVQTNIIGVQNVIRAANLNNVEKVIFTSSDKAVNPTNVMGTTKLMGERLLTAANSNKRGQGPVFTSTRFGNVLGSNGSVVPIFTKQILSGGPVTLTNAKMTRFIMSISDSVRLIIDSAAFAQGGEVLITKMPVMRIIDLARALIIELAPRIGCTPDQIEIKEIGAKPGEKLYEELMSQEETQRAVELENYFSILPAFSNIYDDLPYDYATLTKEQVIDPYVSHLQPAMTVDDIRKFLREKKLLGEPDI